MRASTCPDGRTVTELGLPVVHVAVAVVNRCTYLMTWNYRHLAGAGARARIEAFCRDKGYEPAIICTPEELLEDEP